MAQADVQVKTVKSLAELGTKDLPVNYVKNDEDERPGVASDDFRKEVPVISLANAATGGAEHAELIRVLGAACKEWGMFQVIDHAVPAELNSQMMRCAQEFFSIPVEEKKQYAMSKGQFLGYGNGSFINELPSMDWREQYVTTCSPARDIQSWPAKPVQFREVLAKYSDAMLELTNTLLALISELLQVEVDEIEKACGEGKQKVVLNYYPICPHPELGLERHTDPGTLTIVLQDKVGGLQVTKDHGKTWATVEPVDGAFVVNMGDQMHVLSDGIFKSADHQVVVNSSVRRTSIVTFYNPHPNSIVYPLDPLTVRKGESHTNTRFDRWVYKELYHSKITKHRVARQVKHTKEMSLVQQPEE